MPAALGFEVEGRVADAERLPYDDDSFDLVVGHAVLHHIPDLELAFREILRVLKPGGRFVFAGEPTAHGDYIARRLSRFTWWATTNVTRLAALSAWRRPQAGARRVVARRRARGRRRHPHLRAGRARARIAARRRGRATCASRPSELLASWFGWPVRTFECAVPREKLGMRWANFALQGLDAADRPSTACSSASCPTGLFYNAEITGLKPASMSRAERRAVRPRRHAVRLGAGHPRRAAARLRRATASPPLDAGDRARAARPAVLRVAAAAHRRRDRVAGDRRLPRALRDGDVRHRRPTPASPTLLARAARGRAPPGRRHQQARALRASRSSSTSASTALLRDRSAATTWTARCAPRRWSSARCCDRLGRPDPSRRGHGRRPRARRARRARARHRHASRVRWGYALPGELDDGRPAPIVRRRRHELAAALGVAVDAAAR